jgi:Tol biopolymer transport system component
MMPSLWGWSPDGQSVFLNVYSEDPQNNKVILVRASDGNVRVLGSAEGMSGSIGQASMSPDGRFIAFVRRGGPGYMGAGVSLRTVDGWREAQLSPEGNFPIWTLDGKKVMFVSNRRGPTDLWAIPVAEGRPTGPAELVRENLQYPMPLTRDGELFYQTVTEARDLYTVEFDPGTGRPTSKTTKITHRYVNGGSAWSPDGKLLAYASLRDAKQPGEGDPAALVIRTMDTGAERVVAPKVVFDMNLSNPQWFPDNRSLLIQPGWGQQVGKLLKVDSETGDVQFLFPKTASVQSAGNWYDEGATLSPDGKTLYYHSSINREARRVRILRRELPDGEEKELKSLEAPVTHLSVSPDGRRLAFWMRPDAKDQNIRILTTMPTEGGDLTQVKIGNVFPWSSTAWSRDGKRIFFVGLAQPGADPKTTEACDIWSVPAEGGEPVPLGIDLRTTIWFFHLHPDGKRLVFYDESTKWGLWSLKNLPGVGKAPR